MILTIIMNKMKIAMGIKTLYITTGPPRETMNINKGMRPKLITIYKIANQRYLAVMLPIFLARGTGMRMNGTT